MQLKYTMLISVIFSLTMINTTLADAETKAASQYHIVFSEEPLVRVTATLSLTNDRLYMFEGANHLPRRWAGFVRNLVLNGAEGQAISITEAEDGGWTVDELPAGPVTLQYDVVLEHEQHEWDAGIDGAAYARDWGVFLTGRSLFVANDELRSNIEVSVELPDGWKITTPWQSLDNSGRHFVVADQESLATSMLFAGSHKELLLEQGDFKLRVALGGGALEQEDEFLKIARGSLDYFHQLMGGIPRLASPDGVARSVLIINASDVTDGEVIGNNISMLIEPNGDPMSQLMSRLILTHEFFHLWNGKSIVPANNDAEWFKEGFTNYYTLKALHQMGALDEATFLQVLSGFFYQRYVSDPGVGSLSMSDGELKHSNWGLIYSGGLMVAIAQDLMIRDASNNEMSLDSLMHSLFENFAEDRYTLHDLEQWLSELTGKSQAEFFERYIEGVEPVPVGTYLGLAGLSLESSDGRTAITRNNATTERQLAIRAGMFGQKTDEDQQNWD